MPAPRAAPFVPICVPFSSPYQFTGERAGCVRRRAIGAEHLCDRKSCLNAPSGAVLADGEACERDEPGMPDEYQRTCACRSAGSAPGIAKQAAGQRPSGAASKYEISSRHNGCISMSGPSFGKETDDPAGIKRELLRHRYVMHIRSDSKLAQGWIQFDRKPAEAIAQRCFAAAPAYRVAPQTHSLYPCAE